MGRRVQLSTTRTPFVNGREPTEATTNCPHSYPQVWTGQARCFVVARAGVDVRGVMAPHWWGMDHEPSRRPHFVVWLVRGPFRIETALAEATRFQVGWPTVPRHCERYSGGRPNAGDGCDGSKPAVLLRWGLSGG